uniref:Uncharacterized protein n=1 Tax=Sphaerodactylus townsendi TaxID=933632 RepID=A0ACB8E7R2_9SAUR
MRSIALVEKLELRWLQSVKNYWRETESTMDETTASSAGVTRCTKKLQKQQSEKKSYKVRLVLYGERYNDLEKHVCSLKDNDVVLDHYHPCAALTANHIEKYGIPLDMAFSPRESIQLYDAMLNSWPEWPRAHELEPEEYICFKNKITIKKADVRKYEQDLKEELSGWVAVGEKDKWLTQTVLGRRSKDPAGSFQDHNCRVQHGT